MAFQITDDVLDYVGDPSVLGKPAGGDLRRRQITLPLIYAAANGLTPTLHATIDRIDDGATPAEVERLLAWVQRSVGIERSQQEAFRFCQQAGDALQIFPPSAIRDALEDIAWFVLERER
jgi:geranylgeranyl pyrophosphate synthase